MKHDILWGLFIGSLFTIIFQVLALYIAGPQPYRNVVVKNVEVVEDGYIITAHFTKTDCTFERLEVFGVNTGVPQYLPWEAMDGSPSRDYDRSLGMQFLKVLAKDQERDFETIEIRTRHDCDGVKVDKLFASITLADWQNQPGDL